VWIGIELSPGWAVAAAALVGVPHLVVDDGRPVRWWIEHVKGAERYEPGLAAAVDQSFHVLCLFALALLIGAV
jgi:hypothetical protein